MTPFVVPRKLAIGRVATELTALRAERWAPTGAAPPAAIAELNAALDGAAQALKTALNIAVAVRKRRSTALGL